MTLTKERDLDRVKFKTSAAFQNAQKSEFPSSFFRVPSVPVKSEVGTRKFIEIQVNKCLKWRNLTFSCKLISI